MAISFVTAGAAALAALLISLRFREYRLSAAWFALAAIAQGASLALIEAGPSIRYQHYPPVRMMAAAHPWLLAVLGAQAVFVVPGLIRYLIARAGAGHGPRVWRFIAAAVLSACTAATLSPDVRRYVAELAFAAIVQSLAIGTIALMALAWPANRAPAAKAEGDEAHGHLDRLTWITAGAVTVVGALLVVFVYGRHPHVPDELSYLHQAKYFAQGMLTMPAPPVPAAFDVDLMELDGPRWYSLFTPGWPAVLAVGVRAGAPWLVNPVLAGLNILLTRVVLGHLLTRRLARAGTLLLAASPWFLFLAMSFMAHQLTLTCALLAALGVIRARITRPWMWGLVAGVGVGMVSLIRPLDGAIVGLLIATWSIGFGGRRLAAPALAGLAVGTIAVGSLGLFYNRQVAGSWLTFPLNAYFDKHYGPNTGAYGFGPDRGLGWGIDPNPGHSILDGVININLNMFSLNWDFLGWACGSLICVWFLACSGGWRRRDWIMLTAAIAVIGVYFPYYFSGGPDFGARYWFVLVVPLVVLTIRGLEVMEQWIGSRVWIAAAGLSFLALLTFVPWRAVDKYRDYRGMLPQIREVVPVPDTGSDLVLIRGNRTPDYASGFAENPVDLHAAARIFAWDRDLATRRAVLTAYPDRMVWLVDGPSITGDGYRLTAGPVSARALLESIGR